MSTALFMSCPNCRASISVSRAKVPIVIVCPECMKRFRFDADGEWEGSASASGAGLGPQPLGLPWWQRRSVVANLLGGLAAVILIVCLWWFLTTPSAAEMESKRERIYHHITLIDIESDIKHGHHDVSYEKRMRITRDVWRDMPYWKLRDLARREYGYNE